MKRKTWYAGLNSMISLGDNQRSQSFRARLTKFHSGKIETSKEFFFLHRKANLS